jgi:alcohol dehydrogenase class IV
MNSFEFATPGGIRFGWGSFATMPKLAAQMGHRAMLVMGEGGAKPELAENALSSANVEYSTVRVSGEPTVEFVRQAVEDAKRQRVEFVVAFGGGSVLDTGKAISAMITNPGDLLDYLEIVGRGQSLAHRAAPLIAIPTTAGTGSEVTRNAVLSVPEQSLKVSMRSPFMLPEMALVDPELTLSVPQSVTASTGMDALTQVIEPYVSIKANPMTDLFAPEGIQSGASAIRTAFHHGENREARTKMAWTSLLGGLCLANSGLGAVHGFASPVGGMFDAPHGAICARLLPEVTAVNIRVLEERQPDGPALDRYREIAGWIVGEGASLVDLVDWLRELADELQIPRLSAYGATLADIPGIVEKARNASSMRANPLQLTDLELAGILEKAI